MKDYGVWISEFASNLQESSLVHATHLPRHAVTVHSHFTSLFYCTYSLCFHTCIFVCPYNLYCVGGDVKPYSINQSRAAQSSNIESTKTTVRVNTQQPAVGRRAFSCYAWQHVMILLFQPQGRFDTVLAASPWQDRPPGTLFQHRYAAVIWYTRSVVIWKLNCLPGRITSTLVTVSSCKSRWT